VLPNPHRSNAQELIARVPVIEVHGNVAVCDGGGGALGHPTEYIKLDKRSGAVPATCKYCQMRFRKVGGH
jgi:NADH dehydrogenase (ubiquinone) Fe-S protein 6